jgi:hypothetical protein
MPPSVVKTPDDEQHWTEAKKRAAKQGHAGDYAYIMGIFKRMAKKSLRDRLADLIKARKPVQGHVAKPPPGFEPIPHSKKGGYHKKAGAGYIYWYPGQGIVNDKHEADADTTPHQEATAKHVMDQIKNLEAKGKVSQEEVQHTMTAIRNAWPGGPEHVPHHIMQHYNKLKGMTGMEPEAEEAPPAEEKTPKITVKEGKEKPSKAAEAMTREKEAKARAKEVVRSVKQQRQQEKKQAAEEKRTAKRKAARAKVVTDPKKVPEGFNKMSKAARAKLTANWDQVKEDLDGKYPAGDYAAHPDMSQAITEHIDELAELGHIVPANAGRAKGMLLKQLEYGEKAGVKKEALASLLEENARKLAHQEVESVMRTLGDHGVRHLEVNAHQANRIFDQLEAAGVKISPMDRFMAHQVMIDHDMGYTVPVIARGGFSISDKYHPQASAVLAQQQGDKYRKLFGADGFKNYLRHVETHSGSAVDWKNDPVGSAVRLADNTHLFADKLPEVLFDTNAGVEVLTKIKLASELIPPTEEEVDKDGNVKKVRTPEDKAKLKALIGGIKSQLAKAVKSRQDLPKSTKALLAKAVDEVGEGTPHYMISRLAGRSPRFAFDKKAGDMRVEIEQSPARHAIGEIFGPDHTDKQFKKMLEDFGTDPKAAMDKKPPPPGIRVGDKGSGIEFSWKAPTGDHPTERRYAQVMKDTKARLKEIQGMSGSKKSRAMKRFFGAELQKAMDILSSSWELRDSFDLLEKASTVKPPPGFSPAPRGKKGGYRKRVGGKWVYWYPGQSVTRDESPRDVADKIAEDLESALGGLTEFFRTPDIESVSRGDKTKWAVLASVDPSVARESVERTVKTALAKYGSRISAIAVREGRDEGDDHEIDVVLKSAMGTLAARTGRTRPGTFKPLPDRPTLRQRLSSALGKRPKGTGWEPVGKHGGFRKWSGGRWSYWYPGMSHEGGTEEEASVHRERQGAKQRVKTLEKEIVQLHREAESLRAHGELASASRVRIDRNVKLQQLQKLAAAHGLKAEEEIFMRSESIEKGIKERLGSALGKRPPGQGWIAVPGGKKGGYRKRVGGKWVYWYPGMGRQGGTQGEADRHQAKKDVAHHEKQAKVWHERFQRREGPAAREALATHHEHREEAERLRAKHEITEGTMKSDEPSRSVRVNRCTVHLNPDEALAKSLEDGDLGIGTVPRTYSSKTMMRKSAVGGEGFTEHGADHREEAARAQADMVVIRDDPAGNDGNGGLADWFRDAQRTQEPAVRTPIAMSKAEEPPTRVIDDDDPYVGRLHRMDPRDGQANVDFAYNRDAKRTQ